jgi:hypothetical protein
MVSDLTAGTAIGDILEMSGNATCWICGSDGPLSGEHRVKASDLRDFFGPISPNKPVYFTTQERNARPVYSAKSNNLKTGHVICVHCNTTRTAPFDHAWMTLSRELRRRLPSLSDGKKLRGETVFPYDTRRQMLGVHLFFVKLLGCELADSGDSPFDLSPLSKAVLNERSHPSLYLQFGYGATMGNALHMGSSDINIDALSNGAKFGMWAYSAGGFSAMVALVEYNSPKVPGRWWHPRLGNRLAISDFTLP